MNQYGLHSPFLFDFYKACFKPSYKHSFPSISALRKKLKKDARHIQITDFGAGSHVSNSNTRTVSEMYSSAAISAKQGEFLNRLVEYFRPINVIELGTHVGLSSAYMALNNRAKVISLEGCSKTAEIALQNHHELNLKNIQIEVGSFDKLLPSVIRSVERVDLAYVDGNHSYEGTLWNYEHILPKITDSSVLVFDDINWSPDMRKAWEEISSKSEISLSIDCHKFGIVFFKKGVEKQHFYFNF